MNDSGTMQNAGPSNGSAGPTCSEPLDNHFDPYHTWLAIPPEEQPPDHYRLLGLVRYETCTALIEEAADRQMAHIRRHQLGPHRQKCEALLGQVSRARVCLLDAERKQAYDDALRDPELLLDEDGDAESDIDAEIDRLAALLPKGERPAANASDKDVLKPADHRRRWDLATPQPSHDLAAKTARRDHVPSDATLLPSGVRTPYDPKRKWIIAAGTVASVAVLSALLLVGLVGPHAGPDSRRKYAESGIPNGKPRGDRSQMANVGESPSQIGTTGDSESTTISPSDSGRGQGARGDAPGYRESHDLRRSARQRDTETEHSLSAANRSGPGSRSKRPSAMADRSNERSPPRSAYSAHQVEAAEGEVLATHRRESERTAVRVQRPNIDDYMIEEMRLIPHKPAAGDRLEAQRRFVSGRSLYWQNDLEEAREDLLAAVKADSTQPLYLYFLALAEHRLGNIEEARRYVMHGVRLEQRRPIENWGRAMERCQGDSRLWLEQERSVFFTYGVPR